MIWVVGTGCCGMHKYTKSVGGFIESTEELKELAVKRYHDQKTDMTRARKIFFDRSLLSTSCVTDCGQFMFIDIISDMDKKAEFVWLKRKDKTECVNRFMNRVAEDKRIHPKGWDFNYKNKRRLLEWYVDEVTYLIEKALNGKKFQVVYTEDLK